MIVAGAFLLAVLPVAASAHDGRDSRDHDDDSVSSKTTTVVEAEQETETHESDSTKELREKIEAQKKEARESAKEKAELAKKETKERLDTDKLKACENHKSRINSIMGNMNDRRQKAFDHITSVYTAVTTFYTDKKLTVSGYDELVTTVESAQAAAQTAMETQLAVPDLDCSGDHPRADVTEFKTKRQSSIEAMQNYRQAVKALIKAVKETAETTKGDES